MGKTRRHDKEWGKNPKFKRSKKSKKTFLTDIEDRADFDPAYNNLDRVRRGEFDDNVESDRYYK